MRKLTALIVASGLMFGAASLAHAADAQPAQKDGKPMMRHKCCPGQHHDMMFKGLNLTDAQKTQIRDIMKQQREKMPRPSAEERRVMHDLIASDSFDRAKAQQEVNKAAEQQKTRMLAHMETQNKIYNILTPEQKKEFNARFEKRLTERKGPEGKAPTPAE